MYGFEPRVPEDSGVLSPPRKPPPQRQGSPTNRGQDKCPGHADSGASSRGEVSGVFIEEVACEMRAHLSLEHKYFPAIMINGYSLVSLWEWNSNDDSRSSSDGSNIMVQYFICPALWQGPRALDLQVSLITET